MLHLRQHTAPPPFIIQMAANFDLSAQPAAFPAPVEAAPSPDIATARHRRNIAQSRTARSNITNLVDAIKVAKPPKPPPKNNTHAPNATRRRALIPLAEGRHQLEARIRSLEDTVAVRDEALVHLKRQLGRTLVKRRHADKERENLNARLSETLSMARSQHSAATSARNYLQTAIDDVSTSLHAMSDALASPSLRKLTCPDANKRITDLQIIQNNISDALDNAKAKLSADLPACPTVEEPVLLSDLNRLRTPSIAPSDEDARSCLSYASSMLGEDRDAQIENLVELMNILDGRLSSGPPNQVATDAIDRARRTVSSQRDHIEPHTCEVNSSNEPETDSSRKSQIERLVQEVLKEQLQETSSSNQRVDLKKGDEEPSLENGNIDRAELTQSVISRMELEEARRAAESLQKRVLSLERTAERAMRVDEVLQQNSILRKDLANAKETITRMIRDRGPVRRLGSGSPYVTPGSTPRGPKVLRSGSGVLREDEDVMRRVLDWQQDASTSTTARSTKGENEDSEIVENEKRVNGWNRRLPDRDDSRTKADSQPSERIARRRRASSVIEGKEMSHVPTALANISMGMMTNMADHGGSVAEDMEDSEGSVDIAANEDAGSSQSLPISRMLRRRKTGITSPGIVGNGCGNYAPTNSRNIFRASPAPIDGLRDLLEE